MHFRTSLDSRWTKQRNVQVQIDLHKLLAGVVGVLQQFTGLAKLAENAVCVDAVLTVDPKQDA